MKRIITLVLLVSSVISYSQELIDLGGTRSVSFEDTNDFKYILIDSMDIWQIAKPNKDILFLPADPSNEYALITDTNGYYSDSVFTYLQFRLSIDDGNTGATISFFHKYDFEENKDGGIIETSYNNGETWQNILFDENIEFDYLFGGVHNMYDGSDTIKSYNNQPGFTGLLSDYTNVQISFRSDIEIQGDTMLLRFAISSDSTDMNNEGWMIDEFFFSWYVTDNINNTDKNSSIDIYPNPTFDILTIHHNNEKIQRVEIFTLLGSRLIYKESKEIVYINVSELEKGIYIIKIKSSTNRKYISKFLKL